MYLRVRRKINIKDIRILSFGTLYQFTENLNIFYVISDTFSSVKNFLQSKFPCLDIKM